MSCICAMLPRDTAVFCRAQGRLTHRHRAQSAFRGTLHNSCGLGLCGTAPQHTIRWHSQCGRAQYCVSLRAPVGPSCKTVLKFEASLCSASPPVPFGDAMMRVLPTLGSDGHIEHER